MKNHVSSRHQEIDKLPFVLLGHCRSLPAFPKLVSPPALIGAYYAGLDGQPEHSARISQIDKQVAALAGVNSLTKSRVAHITKHLHLPATLGAVHDSLSSYQHYL